MVIYSRGIGREERLYIYICTYRGGREFRSSSGVWRGEGRIYRGTDKTAIMTTRARETVAITLCVCIYIYTWRVFNCVPNERTNDRCACVCVCIHACGCVTSIRYDPRPNVISR